MLSIILKPHRHTEVHYIIRHGHFLAVLSLNFVLVLRARPISISSWACPEGPSEPREQISTRLSAQHIYRLAFYCRWTTNQECWPKKKASLTADIILKFAKVTAKVSSTITNCQEKILQKASWHFWNRLLLSDNLCCYFLTGALILFNSWVLKALNFNNRSEDHQYKKYISDPSPSRHDSLHRAPVTKLANHS